MDLSDGDRRLSGKLNLSPFPGRELFTATQVAASSETSQWKQRVSRTGPDVESSKSRPETPGGGQPPGMGPNAALWSSPPLPITRDRKNRFSALELPRR
jgi:hypothetical protein